MNILEILVKKHTWTVDVDNEQETLLIVDELDNLANAIRSRANNLKSVLSTQRMLREIVTDAEKLHACIVVPISSTSDRINKGKVS